MSSSRRPLARILASIASACLSLTLLLLLSVGPGSVAPALAGPVSWEPLPSTEEGTQWWDSGSLRRNRAGNLTVLSRFQPAESEGATRPAPGQLYVMELDCGQRLYRDTSINGIPQWGAEWQIAADDGLIDATMEAVCLAAAELP